MSDCSRCVQETIKAFGGLDIIIANAGWTRFSDFADLASMSDDEWTKCWMVNVMGPKKYVEAAMPTFNSNPEGGVVIITGSIAGQSLGGSSMPYSVTKAAQIHMMKCIAKSQGKKLRMNAVLPGLLLTDWGNEYGPERIKVLQEAAALKQEVSIRRLA
jgi:NAD(P)-dependent dehydrogenase (short-subunit alcohol dehydrogenase family)